jgi:hypothetical protein
MALTSRITISIGINCVGQAKFYEQLFGAMRFQKQHLPFPVCNVCGKKGIPEDIFRSKKGDEAATTVSKNQDE